MSSAPRPKPARPLLVSPTLFSGTGAFGLVLLLPYIVFRFDQGPFGVGLVGVVAAVLACAGLGLIAYRFETRRWLLTTDDGFVWIDRRTRREFRDTDVTGFGYAAGTDAQNLWVVRNDRVFTLYVEVDGARRALVCRNPIVSYQPDPLGPLIDRIAQRQLGRARAALRMGDAVHGEGWSLDEGELTLSWRREPESYPLAELEAVELYDNFVLVWTFAQGEPILQLPTHAANAYVLYWLLTERIARVEEPGVPDAGLGRVLLERRTAPATILAMRGESVAVTLAGFALFAVARWHRSPTELLGLGLGAYASWRAGWSFWLQRRVLRCHEHGLSLTTLWDERWLRYEDATGVYFTVGSRWHKPLGRITLRLRPRPGAAGQAISYSIISLHGDPGLERICDRICQIVAARMEREYLETGTVRWLKNLTFERRGLRYKPRNSPRTWPPIFVRWDLIRDVKVRWGSFVVRQAGRTPIAIQEPVNQPDFYPGLYLFMKLMHGSPAIAEVEEFELSQPQGPRQRATEA